MSFALYVFGLAVLLGGIAFGLVTAGLQVTYVVIACLVIAGIGIMMAVSRTRAAMSAPTIFSACSKLMVSSCSPMAALVDGVNNVRGSRAACRRPAGSLMPEMAPVFW